MKIGANGTVGISVKANGDLAVTASETDTLTDESIEIDVHPAPIAAAIVKLLGGASWAQSLVGFLMSELAALAPKS